MSDAPLYERDFYAWANEQGRLLRSGQLSEADIENIAEEIETLARGEKREFRRLLRRLLLRLLRWQVQPVRRSKARKVGIKLQRRALARHLSESPSLVELLAEVTEDAYTSAFLKAQVKTGLGESAFPATCPWSFEQVMAADFWPDGD